MPKRTTPKRKTRRTAPISQAAAAALGPLVLEADLQPADWENLEAAAHDDEHDGEAKPERIPTFRMIAYRGGIMRPRMNTEMYGGGVVLDLATTRAVNGQLPIHYSHDTRDPVGHADSVEIGDRQIAITGRLSVPGPSYNRIVGGARGGFRWRPSIGVRGYTIERLLDGQTANLNGRTIRGPVMIARGGELYETSFLSVAGDVTATATVTATHATNSTLDDVMTFEQFLTAAGIDQDTATDEQLATLQAAYDAQYGETPANTTPTRSNTTGTATEDILRETRETLASESRRINRINNLCAGGNVPTIEVDGAQTDLAAHAIESGMTPEQVELHILRNRRPTGPEPTGRAPAGHSRSRSETLELHAMTAAVLLASGIGLDRPEFQSESAMYAGVPDFLRRDINDEGRQRIMEAGHRYGSVNLLDLAADVVEVETGNRVRGRENRIEAAASSGTLANLYAHTVGASLLVGYNEAVGHVDRWTSRDFVDDFKQVQRFQEDAEASLEYQPPNGEASHATAGARFEYLQADMYTRQFVIDRYAYVNNNLGLLSRKPQAMGAAARRLEEDFAIAVVLSNPTMNSTGRALFNATDGTLHASHALTNANASKGISYLQKRKDGDKTLGFMPGFGLVPSDLQDLAARIFNSQFIDSADGTMNALREYGVMAIGSARLSNGVTHPKTKAFAAGSTTAWYLLAKDIEVAVRVYLQETGGVPQARVTQLTQGKWGTHIDICHDFGFGFVSHLGMDKFTA